MYANKKQEQFILNAKKQKAEKEKKKAVSTQKTSSVTKNTMPDITTTRKKSVDEIAKEMATQTATQKSNYDQAYGSDNFAGTRIANTNANLIRQAQGFKPQDSSVGDMQHINSAVSKGLPVQNSARLNTSQTIKPSSNTVTTGYVGRGQYQDSNALIERLKASATRRALAGAVQEFTPIQADYAPKVQAYLDQSGNAYEGGKIGGTVASFATGYGALGKGVIQGATKIAPKALPKLTGTVTKGVAKVLPKLSEETASKIGTGIVQSGIKDLAIGAPLNANYAYNKEGLRGKDFARSMAINTALDLGIGSVLEFAPIVLKSGKKVANVEDLKDLKTSEKAEAVQQINNNRKKLANTTVRGNVKPLPQASNQAIQPQNIDLGTMVQQEVKAQPIPIRKPLAKSIEKTPSIEDKMKAIEAEHNRTVDVVHNYIKNYKPKGVDINLVPKSNEYGADEFFRQNASKNDLWYQDFYKENGRKPNVSEMRELAEKLVMQDLDDIHGEFHNADLADMINKLDEPQNNAIEPQTFKRGTNTPKRPFQSVGADLNSNPSKYKVSQLRTNTIENSEQFANLKGDMPQENFEYEVRPEKVTLAEAKQRLEVDFNGEVKDLYSKTNFDGADTDTAMGIAKTYGEEATQTGNYTRLNNWSKQIQEKATEQGQAIQAFAKYTRTPEGKVIEGQSEVAKVQREIAKDNPRLTDKVNQETKSIIDVISGAEKETLESISEMINKMLKGEEATPSDLLARKVINTTKTPKAPKENAINDMVNELFRVAKESPLPSTLKTKSNPVDYLAKAIQNKELYTDTWNKAKDVIKAKYDGKEEVLNMLDDYFDKGIIPTYSKSTIDKSIRQTAKELTVDFSKIIKQSAGDKEKALQDITDLLINKTGATGEDASLLAKNITDQYNAILKARTESTLKQMFREVPKKGQKTTYQKVMELINMGAYDNQAIKDIIRAKNNIPVMDNEDIKGIFENMKKAESETDPYMKRMYEAKAQQIISDKIPATKMEKFAGLQRQSMLINPKTLLTRNPLGNVVLGTAENIKDIPASMIDKAISLKTGQRTTTLNPQFGSQLKGIAQGTKEWAKDIKYGVDTSPTRAQFELPNKRIFDNKILNAADKFLGRALQLGDRPFYQAAYDGRIAELKTLGVTGEEAETQARLFALDRVFQNDSVLSKNALIIRDKLGLPGRLIMPFAQTPANIMDKLLDYSPVGMAKAVSQLGTVGKGTFNQKLFVDRLGRAFTGTGIAMLGYAMASKGILTGNEYNPTNKDLNAANTKAGIQSYAIKVGDKWHSYDFAQPIGGLLAAAADAYNAGQEGKDFLSSLGAGGTAAVNTVFNQSFMSGLLDAFSGYGPAEGIGGSLLSSTTQITPTIINNITKTTDPYTRETYDPNLFKQQGNKLIARLPFASKTLPKKLDASGQPIMQNQGRGIGAKTLENFLLPQKVTEIKKDTVNDELLRLNKSTGENEMLLNVAPKQFSKGGQTYTLSSKDYTNYQETMGQYANKKMTKLMETESYKKLSDTDKVDKLQKINESAAEQARMEYFENNGMSPLLALDKSVQKKYEKVKGTGITLSDFISIRNQSGEYRTSLSKISTILNAYPDNGEAIAKGLGYSKGSIQNAKLFIKKGIEPTYYEKYKQLADTNGDGKIKAKEAHDILKNENLSTEQRAYLIRLLQGTALKEKKK